MIENNPLLDFSGLPRFNDIDPEHIVPALEYLLDDNRKQIDVLTASESQADWQNMMLPLEELADRLDRFWAPVSHLNAVKDSNILREAYENCLPKLTEYASQMGQNADLYKKFLQLRKAEGFDKFSSAKKRTIDNEIRDFRLSGIELDEKSQKLFRQLNIELSDLGNKFSKNLLDATDAWSLHTTDKTELEGVPPNSLDLARKKAKLNELEGWEFTLHGPSYIPFVTYANNSQLREKMYRAYVTRASETGPHGGEWDNSDLICRILDRRRQLANLLGFKDYVSYSLETKMAGSAEEVSEFLHDLAAHSKSAATREVKEIRKFAKANYKQNDLQPWDYAWFSEKLKKHEFDFDQETLRSYFPLPKVLQGLFEIVYRLFGISVTPESLDHSWHEDVRFFKIKDHNDQVRGYFYVDLFARQHKRGGAWMADCIGRRIVNGNVQLPVAFLTCNFSEAVGGKPALLTHEEVMTLFHEFGHGLHHLLTKVDVSTVAGINGVPWDAVELPSQFLENWCWDKKALDLTSGHYQTEEGIPSEVFDKMLAGKNFQSAMQMLRQIEFSLFDLEIHKESAEVDSPAAVRAILADIRNKIAVVEVPEFNRFENSFNHIFSGGYAAGYYSYKWAEVLSADAFGRFEEEGIFDAKAGKEFLECVLEKGGSEDPMDLFRCFRGRNPDVGALLRHSGLS